MQHNAASDTNRTPVNPAAPLALFKFKTAAIRVIQIGDEPWFVAADVYGSIGLSKWGGILNPLNDNEKTLRGRTSLGLPPGRDVWVISESGLYKLIMRSDKKEAREFQQWVTDVVLPAIRKDGGYVIGEEKLTTGEMGEDEFLARAFIMANKKLERLTAELAAAQPKIELAGHIGSRPRSFTHVIRQFEGVNTMAAKSDLVREGYFYQVDGKYRVYAKYRGMYFTEKFNDWGYTDVFVEQKGYELLATLYEAGRLTMKRGQRPMNWGIKQ